MTTPTELKQELHINAKAFIEAHEASDDEEATNALAFLLIEVYQRGLEAGRREGARAEGLAIAAELRAKFAVLGISIPESSNICAKLGLTKGGERG